MDDFLSIINIVAALGATIISTITLFTTKSLQRMEQRVNVMANKRSERIDLMREYSASTLTCAKQILHGINLDENEANIIASANNFISLLQYEYEHDIELIDSANRLVTLCLADVLDKGELKKEIELFWKKCDVYVGVEYERLKLESKGAFNKSGDVKNESNTFEQIYQKLLSQQK